MDDDLIAFTRRAGVDPVVERSLSDQYQSVRLLLSERARFRGSVHGVERGGLGLLDIARRLQRLHEHRASFGLQPPAHHYRAVYILIHMECSMVVAALGFLGLGLAIHTTPAADDALHVLGGARTPHREQPLFRLRRGHAR